VLILFWIGLLKFTSYEANGIKPFVENSPFMRMYSVWSVQAASNVIGVEVASAVLIAARPWSALASAIGSAGSLHFLNVELLVFDSSGAATRLRFPFYLLRQDSLKILLLGAAVWSLAESLKP